MTNGADMSEEKCDPPIGEPEKQNRLLHLCSEGQAKKSVQVLRCLSAAKGKGIDRKGLSHRNSRFEQGYCGVSHRIRALAKGDRSLVLGAGTIVSDSTALGVGTMVPGTHFASMGLDRGPIRAKSAQH